MIVAFGLAVDRAEDLVEAQAVLHRQDVFREQIARVFTDDGGAKDAVLPRGVRTLTKPAVMLSVIARSS